MSDKQKNVLGEDLEECSNNPLTGWYRDGCCNTDENDHGVHTVCAKVTTEFLEWLKVAGNDLITPHPEFGFPGLKDGDGWCVCASWYAKAVEAGKGCPVFLKRSHPRTKGQNLGKQFTVLCTELHTGDMASVMASLY